MYKRVILVDYENVCNEGLAYVDKLTEENKVVIFFSKNANHMTFQTHQKLMESKASIEYLEVTVGGRNALDFQLSTYLGYLAGKREVEEYFIISKDNGFKHVESFGVQKLKIQVSCKPYIGKHFVDGKVENTKAAEEVEGAKEQEIQENIADDSLENNWDDVMMKPEEEPETESKEELRTELKTELETEFEPEVRAEIKPENVMPEENPAEEKMLESRLETKPETENKREIAVLKPETKAENKTENRADDKEEYKTENRMFEPETKAENEGDKSVLTEKKSEEKKMDFVSEIGEKKDETLHKEQEKNAVAALKQEEENNKKIEELKEELGSVYTAKKEPAAEAEVTETILVLEKKEEKEQIFKAKKMETAETDVETTAEMNVETNVEAAEINTETNVQINAEIDTETISNAEAKVKPEGKSEGKKERKQAAKSKFAEKQNRKPREGNKKGKTKKSAEKAVLDETKVEEKKAVSQEFQESADVVTEANRNTEFSKSIELKQETEQETRPEPAQKLGPKLEKNTAEVFIFNGTEFIKEEPQEISEEKEAVPDTQPEVKKRKKKAAETEKKEKKPKRVKKAEPVMIDEAALESAIQEAYEAYRDKKLKTEVMMNFIRTGQKKALYNMLRGKLGQTDGQKVYNDLKQYMGETV